MTTASICTIGDEILIGQIVDTNSSKIASALNAAGVKVNEMISVSDNGTEILNGLEHCLRTSHVVVVTGGLGPTKDDITKKTLADLTGAVKYYESAEQIRTQMSAVLPAGRTVRSGSRHTESNSRHKRKLSVGEYLP